MLAKLLWLKNLIVKFVMYSIIVGFDLLEILRVTLQTNYEALDIILRTLD